jgi:hypothetical protein
MYKIIQILKENQKNEHNYLQHIIYCCYLKEYNLLFQKLLMKRKYITAKNVKETHLVAKICSNTP